jgi:hypothetical protein
MADQPSSQSNAKTIIVTAIISAAATVLVSFIGILPQLKKGDHDAPKPTATTSPPATGDRWTITGVVTKGDSTPVSNAEVYLLPATGAENITATDDKGGFVFENMPLRPYWIVTRDNSSGSSNRVLMGGDNKDGVIHLTGSVITFHLSKE